MLIRILVMLAGALLCGCTGLRPRPDPPTVEQVVQMSRDKTDAAQIVRRMHESDAVYRLSASQLAQLREQGVPDAVIDYMQNTWLDAVRRQEAERYYYDMWPRGMGLYGPRGRFYWPWGPSF